MEDERAREELDEAIDSLVEAPEQDRATRVDKVEEIVANDVLASSYARLQFLIGTIAFLLPVVVALFDWLIDDQGIRGSISSYYYGRTGGWFVGSLCAIGVFLLSYNLRPRPGFGVDNILTNLASVAVIGVALFPTSSEGEAATGGSAVVALVHVICAGVFFVLLAVLALFFFTRIDDRRYGFRRGLWRAVRNDPGTSPSRQRDNLVYRLCGWTIVACLALIVVNNALDLGWLFWLEAVIVWAFGVSWLRKSANVARALRKLTSVVRMGA
ncbi:MAG: hypothetical protein KDB21_02445 [Acidimicrobiales bacterium]|nr:hypothetical protein [Acidimicrobiales bacterium]